jgi:S1-C subfamily serine protease
MFKLATVALLSLTVFSAHARLQLIPDVTSTNAGDKEDYRLGDEWGKKRVTEETLKTESKAFNRAAAATALLPVGGTGFYIGKFNGIHVLATNHHVCPSARDCEGDKASFRILKKSYTMKKLFISEPNIDLALLALDVPSEDEAVIAKVAKNFAFKKSLTKGQELITIGFGIGGNPQNYMMANKDSDCKVFSKTNEFKHLADPDEFNPADYKAWSFAHACDISHGDSGSAMVDRATGDVVGIVWTGKIPKAKIVQSSANLKQMFDTTSPSIWKELSFAVPAAKIGEYLKKLSSDSQLDDETKLVFKAIIK